MMQYIHLILIAMLLNIIIKVNFVESNKCYQCRSDEEPDCAETPVSKTYLLQCIERTVTKLNSLQYKKNHAWCRKISQSLFVGNRKKEVTIRECAFHYENETCYSAPYPSTNYQITCDCATVGCNKALRTMASWSSMSERLKAVIGIIIIWALLT